MEDTALLGVLTYESKSNQTLQRWSEKRLTINSVYINVTNYEMTHICSKNVKFFHNSQYNWGLWFLGKFYYLKVRNNVQKGKPGFGWLNPLNTHT